MVSNEDAIMEKLNEHGILLQALKTKQENENYYNSKLQFKDGKSSAVQRPATDVQKVNSKKLIERLLRPNSMQKKQSAEEVNDAKLI